ncbi:hypothetical protein ACRN9G_18380, partial [Shewanella frigidimarina]
QVDTDYLNCVGIYKGDLLIINRALTPRDKDIIVAEEDGEWVCVILDAKMQCLSTLQCNQGSHMEEKH